MAPPPDATPLFELTAAAFQVLVAGLILAAAHRSWIHRAFSLLFVFNALESLNPDAWLPSPWSWWLGARLLDTYTVVLLVYLMAQFPGPPRRRGARLALRAGVGSATVAWTLLALAAPGADPDLVAPWAKEVLHSGAILVAGGLLFLRMVPGYLGLDRGPLQTQTLLVACAFGIHFVRLGSSAVLGLGLDPGPAHARAGAAAQGVLLLYAAWAGARLVLASADGTTRRRHVLLLGFLLAGAALAILDRWLSTVLLIHTQEATLYVVRPLVVAYAMVRFDLFTLPPAWKRFGMPLTGAAFLAMGFVLSYRVFSSMAEPLGPGRALSSLAALGVVAAVGSMAVAVGPGLGLSATPDPERIETYRIALERARLDAPSPEGEERLAALRRRLRITDEEHGLLRALLDRHVFVPAGSIAVAQPGQMVGGRFEVVRELGRGGSGRALLARDCASDGALVVMKELLEPWAGDALSRSSALRREFEVARKVDSPRVARSIELLDDGVQRRLVRAFVPGRTLREVVRERGALPPPEAARVVGDVLEGLRALHGAGILHLDLKPENVVLDERGRAVLIDFGTARPEAPASATLGATRARPREGTLPWMAPEQVLGRAPDARTDVFAAGALLFYLLSGRAHVPEDATAFEVEEAIVHGAPVRLDAPAPLRAAVRKALARDPRRRFVSAAAMAAALAPTAG